jgi:hypothetical protein
VIEDFRALLQSLTDRSVRFLIVGAHALAAHGIPRMTGDLDVWIATDPANARRTWQALAEFGAPLDALGLTPADFEASDRVIQFGLPPFRVDVMTSVSGLTFEGAWDTRHEGVLLDVPVLFLGRDALIRNKRASGRRKDLDDAHALEAERPA